MQAEEFLKRYHPLVHSIVLAAITIVVAFAVTVNYQLTQVTTEIKVDRIVTSALGPALDRSFAPLSQRLDRLSRQIDELRALTAENEALNNKLRLELKERERLLKALKR